MGSDKKVLHIVFFYPYTVREPHIDNYLIYPPTATTGITQARTQKVKPMFCLQNISRRDEISTDIITTQCAAGLGKVCTPLREACKLWKCVWEKRLNPRAGKNKSHPPVRMCEGKHGLAGQDQYSLSAQQGCGGQGAGLLRVERLAWVFGCC